MNVLVSNQVECAQTRFSKNEHNILVNYLLMNIGKRISVQQLFVRVLHHVADSNWTFHQKFFRPVAIHFYSIERHASPQSWSFWNPAVSLTLRRSILLTMFWVTSTVNRSFRFSSMVSSRFKIHHYQFWFPVPIQLDPEIPYPMKWADNHMIRATWDEPFSPFSTYIVLLFNCSVAANRSTPRLGRPIWRCAHAFCLVAIRKQPGTWRYIYRRKKIYSRS